MGFFNTENFLGGTSQKNILYDWDHHCTAPELHNAQCCTWTSEPFFTIHIAHGPVGSRASAYASKVSSWLLHLTRSQLQQNATEQLFCINWGKRTDFQFPPGAPGLEHWHSVGPSNMITIGQIGRQHLPCFWNQDMTSPFAQYLVDSRNIIDPLAVWSALKPP